MDRSGMVGRFLAKAKYKYQSMTKQDIVSALTHYTNLQPKLEKYTYSNGKEEDLVALDGTVRVCFRSNYYNIPVCIFLNKDHPYSAPMCYVRPTSNMLIKVSEHVNKEGQVFVPYLTQWSSDRSDLMGAIQVMVLVFGENPPVYQKPKVEVPPQYPFSQTPYPTQPGYPKMPAPPSSASYGMPIANNTSTSGVTTPPYPTYPFSSYPPQENPGTSFAGYPPVPGYPPNTATSQTENLTGTITEEHIRDSLISAVTDVVRSKLRERIGKTRAEIDVLKKYNSELTEGKQGVEKMIKQMKSDINELELCKRQLKSKNEQIDELLQKVEKEYNKSHIDDAFGPQEPLYKQLLNTFAEENATVDAIYYLGEALKKEVIDLEVFLKNVRELSRKQFMLRALMQKCREKAGLPY